MRKYLLQVTVHSALFAKLRFQRFPLLCSSIQSMSRVFCSFSFYLQNTRLIQIPLSYPIFITPLTPGGYLFFSPGPHGIFFLIIDHTVGLLNHI